jgi:hypothetical protein
MEKALKITFWKEEREKFNAWYDKQINICYKYKVLTNKITYVINIKI